MASKHPLDLARAALIGDAPKRKRAVLAAHLDDIRTKRERDSHGESKRLVSADAARGALGNSAAMRARFEAATGHAERARGAIIKAAIAAGVKDDNAIISFVRTDLEHFLSSFAHSEFSSQGPAGAGVAQSCVATANALGAAVRNLVTIARDEYDEALPPAVERLTRRLARNAYVSIPLAAIPWVIGVVKVCQEAVELYRKLSPH